MGRKRAICYLVMGIAISVLVLVILAMVSIWLMLLALLLIILAVGLYTQKNPEILDVFKASGADGRSSRSDSRTARSGSQEFAPRMVLVNMHTGPLEQVIVTKPVFTVGRSPSCDYTPPNISYISGVHATIYIDVAQRKVMIKDNGSQNGTFVNNLRLPPEQKYQLSVGDIIQIGTMRFRVEFAHF